MEIGRLTIINEQQPLDNGKPFYALRRSCGAPLGPDLVTINLRIFEIIAEADVQLPRQTAKAFTLTVQKRAASIKRL